MSYQLTQQAIQQIYSGATPPPPQPVLQVIDIKQINGTANNGTLRYRYLSIFLSILFLFFGIISILEIQSYLMFCFFLRRIIVSDGTNFQQAMLATQLNQLVQDEQLIVRSIVQLNEYICNSVHGRR